MPEKDFIEEFFTLPTHVKRQADAADAALKSIKESVQTQSVPPVVAPQTEPGATPPVAPVAPVAPVKPAGDSGAVVAPSPSPPKSDDASFEQKYKVLQGKYNKEISELKESLDSYKAELDRQKKEFEELKEEAKNKAHSPAPVDLTDSSFLKEEDFEGYGEEVVRLSRLVNQLVGKNKEQEKLINSLVSKVDAKAAPGPQFNKEIETRVELMEKDLHSNKTLGYNHYLDTHVRGDWRAINRNPNFLKWLEVVDPVTLKTRMEILQQAHNAFRSDQVASIFNLFADANKQTHDFKVADEIPSGGEISLDQGDKSKMSEKDIVAARNDFVAGKITEAQYDEIYRKYQTSLQRR